MSLFAPLRSHPDVETIEKLLEESLSQAPDKKLTIEDKLLIIKYLLPLTPSLQKSTLVNIFALFKLDFSLLSQLIRTIQNLEQTSKERHLLQGFLIDYLSTNPSIIYDYIVFLPPKNNTFQKNSIKALFFGSQIFNLLYDDKGTFTILDYITILTRQWVYIVAKVPQKDTPFKQWNILASFLSSMLSFHPNHTSSSIIDEIFLMNSKNLHVLLQILEHASLLEKSRLVDNFILPCLELKCNPNNYSTIYKIIWKLFNIRNYYIDPERIISLKSMEFKEIVVRSISKPSENKKLVEILIDHFKDSSAYLDTIDEEVQNENDNTIAQLLFICLKYNFCKEERLELSHHEKFLDCVTYRLQNKDSDMRERTMFLAKFLTEDGLKYESDFKIHIPDIVLANNSSDIDFKSLNEPQERKVVPIGDTRVTTMSNQITGLTLNDSDDEDSDDEEIDNLPGTKRKHIVFLKDLLNEYIKGSNPQQRSDLVYLLKHTVKLVRQKRLLPLEVSYYAEELMKNVVTLNNNFEQKDFEQWRINALISILVVVPDKIDDLFKILFTTDLSLQQRMSILSCIGLASRELRGIDDENVIKPHYDFPSKRLPWDVPPAGPERARQIEEISDNSTDGSHAGQIIGTGTTRWRSKKLELTAEKKGVKKNEFRKHAGKFFYPLVNGWLNGIDLGTYDKLFKAHYISTLRIVYSCANPVHNYDEMTQMMELVLGQAMEQKIPINL